ncbi:MAG TPA: hypothetical protein VKH44_15505, partial [Pirellulaceae bacterium]|nr:hypothetical protein [Pirellulaceae bacterium]
RKSIRYTIQTMPAGDLLRPRKITKHGRSSMPRLPLSFIAAATLLTVVPAARGELPQSLGRYLGIGWSDGYHAYTACPPKPHIIHHKHAAAAFPVAAPPSAPLPWWKIPAAPTEPTSSESGPSLFRQPGEGSSVTTSGGPNL